MRRCLGITDLWLQGGRVRHSAIIKPATGRDRRLDAASSVGWVYSPTSFVRENVVGEYTHPTKIQVSGKVICGTQCRAGFIPPCLL